MHRRVRSLVSRGLPCWSAALGIIALTATAAHAAGDAAKGKADFVRQCALCHTIGKDEPNRYGPNLFGIVGRQAGSVPGFKYTPAFKSSANWVWTPDVLGAWISSPAIMVPGSRMAIFEGVADRDKDDIIAYLASQK
ncbi:MAG TPA: c-type cytochrome [Xanthobacteraceae bacterium]